MRDRIDIDHTHSSAISQEIGERLQSFLGKQPGPVSSLRKNFERLGELDRQSPSLSTDGAEASKRFSDIRQGTGRFKRWLRLPQRP
jgi:hypothetical protein